MANSLELLAQRLQERFRDAVSGCTLALDELTINVDKAKLMEVCRALRDEDDFHFEQIIDLCVVDYSTYGEPLWSGPRFAVVYNLLSVKNNRRLRLKVFLEEKPVLRVDSVTSIWNCADWYEREAFDLFGVLFEGHPDLRRILTDYGFIGHPFRKDFPLSGNVEMRYDPDKQRVVYEPVNIEPRVLVPKIIRDDNRYEGKQQKGGA